MHKIPLQKRFSTISWRMPLLYALVILFLGVVMLAASIWRTHENTLERLSQQLKRIVATAALQIDGDAHQTFTAPGAEQNPEWRKIRDFLGQVREMNDLEYDHIYTFNFPDQGSDHLQFAVMLQENTFVGDVYEVHEANIDLIAKVHYQGEVVASKRYTDQNGTWLSAFAPIRDSNDNIVGLLEADYRFDKHNETYYAALTKGILSILPIFIIMLSIGFVLTHLIARTVSRPIQELVAVTEYTADGHWDHPVPAGKWEELRRLGVAFDSMRHKVKTQMIHLHELNTNLEIKVEERTKDLSELNDQLTAIQNIIASVNEMTRMEDVLKRMGTAIADLIGLEAMALLLPVDHRPDHDDQRMVEHFSLRTAPDNSEIAYQCSPIAFHLPTGMSCTTLKNLDEESRQKLAGVLTPDALGSILMMPLRVRDELAGTLILGHSRENVYDQEACATLENIGVHIAAAIQKARMIDSLSALNEEIRQAQESLKERSQAEIEYQRKHDTLTGLKNRVFLQERVTIEIAKAQVEEGKVGLINLDVDDFKKVNDSLGTEMGDKVLKEIARRLAGHLREQDTLARVGGNEFAVLLPELFDEEDAGILTRRLGKALGEPIHIGRIPIHLTVSAGIATYPSGCEGPKAILSNAAIALKRAKKAGSNRHMYFNLEMNVESERRLILENALRQAIADEDLNIVYQPQVRVADKRVIGAEALLRWEHPDLGFISPGEFIPLAESTGLIVPIGWWVIHKVCAQIRAWQEAGIPPQPVGINISARQFQQPDLVSQLKEILHDTGVDAALVELEITEGVAMDNVETTLATLSELHALGIKLAIDDFGTGYSSLSYLKRFAIHRLKIDRSFIMDLPDNESDAAIATAVIQMGHALGLNVIAEGVETEEQLDFLFENGCDEIQGYFFSRPVPEPQMREHLLTGAISAKGSRA